MQPAVRRGDAAGGVGMHPERSGFVMRRAEAVAVLLQDLHRLAVREDVRHLHHGRVHDVPKVAVLLRRLHGDEGARHAVLVDAVRVEVDAARMRVEVREVGRLHLPDAADGDGHELIVRG